ncbi:unnamed protein product [Toxocara canis]|uniref:Uncharacterized protein n=1 Tax=Toxocara canis TaxID=6265 RepID=A0A183UUV8_TOXCA|nr:unnamed protein product [Toxocara canis]
MDDSKFIAEMGRLFCIIQPNKRVPARSSTKVLFVEHAKPSRVETTQVKPSQAKPSQAGPGQARPGQARPSQAKQRIGGVL